MGAGVFPPEVLSGLSFRDALLLIVILLTTVLSVMLIHVAIHTLLVGSEPHSINVTRTVSTHHSDSDSDSDRSNHSDDSDTDDPDHHDDSNDSGNSNDSDNSGGSDDDDDHKQVRTSRSANSTHSADSADSAVDSDAHHSLSEADQDVHQSTDPSINMKAVIAFAVKRANNLYANHMFNIMYEAHLDRRRESESSAEWAAAFRRSAQFEELMALRASSTSAPVESPITNASPTTSTAAPTSAPPTTSTTTATVTLSTASTIASSTEPNSPTESVEPTLIFRPSNRIQNNNIASFPTNEANSRIDVVTDPADDSSSAVGVSSSESNGESSDTDENAFQFFSVNHHVNLQPAHPSLVYFDEVAESDDDVSYSSDRFEEEVYYRAVYDDLAYGIRTAIECFRSKAPRTINVLASTDPPTIPTLSQAYNNPNLFQVSFLTPYEESYHYPVLSKVESSSVIDWLVYNLVIARFLDVQLKVAQIMAEDNYIFPDNREDAFDGLLDNSEDYDSDVSHIDDALYSPILPECLQKLKSSFTRSRKARQVRRRLRQRRNALTIDSEAELREFAAQIRGVPLDSDTDTDSNSDLDLNSDNDEVFVKLDTSDHFGDTVGYENGDQDTTAPLPTPTQLHPFVNLVPSQNFDNGGAQLISLVPSVDELKVPSSVVEQHATISDLPGTNSSSRLDEFAVVNVSVPTTANSFDVHAVDAVPAVSTITTIPIHEEVISITGNVQDVNGNNNSVTFASVSSTTTIASTTSVVSTKPTTSTQPIQMKSIEPPKPTEQTTDPTEPAELYSSYASQSAVDRQLFKTESTRASIPGTLVTLAFKSFMRSGLRSVPQTILFRAAKNAANMLVESDLPTSSKQL
nr:MAG: hypothetical protein [Apis mellifera filamentous virus]